MTPLPPPHAETPRLKHGYPSNPVPERQHPGSRRRAMTRLTHDLARRFAAAREAERPADGACDGLLTWCPACGEAVYVVEVTGMDGRRYHGTWRLVRDGFAWGADREGNGSTEREIVECGTCGLRRPLADFDLQAEDAHDSGNADN